MKKVYQTIYDKKNGNCIQAVVASLLELELEQVPHFLEFGDDWWNKTYSFLDEHGYSFNGNLQNINFKYLLNPKSGCYHKEQKPSRTTVLCSSNLKNRKGFNGFFYAVVLSPNYFDYNNWCTHAVVCDANLKIVHDPSIGYKSILQYPLKSILNHNGIIEIKLFEKQ